MVSSLGDLSRFERALWCFSSATLLLSFFLSGSRDLLTLTASLIGVTALLFVAKGYVIGQVLTIIFAVFYGIISFYFRYYGEMITYLCMTAPIAALTAREWLHHPYQGTREVEVNRLNRRQLLLLSLAAALVTALFYFILEALGNANLAVSTFSITTSFLAAGLTFFRSPYYAVAYAANDLVLIVLWIMATLEHSAYLPMAVCFALFFANDMYGFYNWKRMQSRQTI